jgi:hypothetical protein
MHQYEEIHFSQQGGQQQGVVRDPQRLQAPCVLQQLVEYVLLLVLPLEVPGLPLLIQVVLPMEVNICTSTLSLSFFFGMFYLYIFSFSSSSLFPFFFLYFSLSPFSFSSFLFSSFITKLPTVPKRGLSEMASLLDAMESKIKDDSNDDIDEVFSFLLSPFFLLVFCGFCVFFVFSRLLV